MKAMKASAGLGLTLLALMAATPARSADFEPVEPLDAWRLTLAGYFWAAGLDGDVGLFGREPVKQDMSFSDIFDDLKFGAMGAAELHNGTWGFYGDVMYAHTESKDGIERDIAGVPTSLDAVVDSETLTATLMGEYRLVDDERIVLDMMAGIRLWNADNDISVKLTAGGADLADFSGDDGDTWVDPMIGVKTRIDTSSPIYFNFIGMVGGFGVAADIDWDVFAGVGYQWTESFATVAGYRALGVDYDNDGFVFDVVQQGVLVGGVYKF